MKNATGTYKEVLARLKEKGCRMTQARTAVVKTLSEQGQPISIQELASLLSKIDEASVYRTVRLLEGEGLVEEIATSGGPARFALAHGHHHHAVCTSCGFVEHLACTLHAVQASVPKQFRSVDAHELTLYGLCKKCA